MKSASQNKSRHRADNALNFMITSELKSELISTARQCGVNATDLVRLSLRAMLPVISALEQGRALLIAELLIPKTRKLRKRHLGLEEDVSAPLSGEAQESRQGSGPW